MEQWNKFLNETNACKELKVNHVKKGNYYICVNAEKGILWRIVCV